MSTVSWEGGGADCFVLADQNFVATLPGTDSKNCLKIVRVENASLSELSGIFIEIMENKFIKPGSCVLISSLSFLSRVGVSAYAAEWRICINMLTSKWPGILVSPVFPIHFSVIPGSLFGDLLVLHSWFSKMYTGTNQGLSQAWDRYVEHLRNFSEGAENLDSPETSSPLLPSTLDLNSGFVPHKFASSTTSPAVIFSFDRHTAYELLLSLSQPRFVEAFQFLQTPRSSSQGNWQQQARAQRILAR
jgi:hypothetical protein